MFKVYYIFTLNQVCFGGIINMRKSFSTIFLITYIFHCTSLRMARRIHTRIRAPLTLLQQCKLSILINIRGAGLAKPFACSAELCKSLRQWKSQECTQIFRVIGFYCTLSSQFVSLAEIDTDSALFQTLFLSVDKSLVIRNCRQFQSRASLFLTLGA